MDIHAFPITADHALALVRQAVEQGEILIPNPPEGGEWYRLVTFRQVNACLREGGLIGEPWVDEHGHVRCVLERFGAGLAVRVHIALMKVEAKWRIVVIEVENRL